MIEKKIDELREKLHLLINEKASYDKVLKASQELDDCISEFTARELKEDKNNKR